LYYASTTNQSVKWNFFEEVYSKFSWTKRPVGTLEQLYKERAQQIRDKYDYVALHFSGGSDSWTVLDSFLSNGIHLDELYTRWPSAERKYRTINNIDKSEGNIISEFDYAVVPVLDYVRKNFPQTKIVVADFSDAFEKDFVEVDLRSSDYYANMSTFDKNIRPSDSQAEAHKQGKKVALVYGCDKIRFTIKNGQFYAYFIQCLPGSDYTEYGREMFYWTPDFPTIPILQAHYLRDYVQTNPNFALLTGREATKTYQSVCYPRYNKDTFQTGKPLGSIVRKSDSWIYEYNPRYYQSWQWAMNQYFDSIDEKFINRHNDNKNGLILGTKRFTSHYYLVGPMPGFADLVADQRY